jgi:hypothetical protein
LKASPRQRQSQSFPKFMGMNPPWAGMPHPCIQGLFLGSRM